MNKLKPLMNGSVEVSNYLSIERLMRFLFDNEKAITEMGISINHANFDHDIDEYESVHGNSFTFDLMGDLFEVGLITVTEDHQDWAQAESHTQHFCRCNNKNIKAIQVYDRIINYKKIKRQETIKNIMK